MEGSKTPFTRTEDGGCVQAVGPRFHIALLTSFSHGHGTISETPTVFLVRN